MGEPAQNARLTRLVVWSGVAIGVLANIGGVLGIFGVTGSLTLGYTVCAAGVLILAVALALGYISSLRAERRRLLDEVSRIGKAEIEMSNILSTDSLKAYLRSRAIKEVHVLGSGTETYYIVLSQFFNEAVMPPGLTVHIGFRVGTKAARYAKLREYETKWQSLAQKYNLRLHYYPYQDFFFLIRGLVIDDDLGFVGFYHRIKDDTIGVDEPVVIARKENPVGAFLLKNYLKVFDCLTASDSIDSAIAGMEGRDAPLH